MLYTAFLFGLISSFHCIGMCGPIAMMLPVTQSNQQKKALQISTYHLGRLVAYATIGLVFGLLGKGFFMAGLQQSLSIVVGVVMIAIVIVPDKVFAKHNFSKSIYIVISKTKQALGNQFKTKTYKSFFTIGLLNGFLPCGMVYIALFGAMAMQSASWGMFYMILFGLGTAPLMTTVVYLNSFINQAQRNRIRKIIPYAAIGIGCLFILRGLGLGIPYVSPSNLSLFIQSTPNCH